MQSGIKYKVTTSLSAQPVGYFLDGIYYEPYGSDRPTGHIDDQGQLVYYVVKPGEKPSVRGRLEMDALVRDDGFHFLIEPDA